jgi:hypothetical protein
MIPFQKMKKIGITWHHCDGTRLSGTGSACNITNGITLHPKTRQSERPFGQQSSTGLFALCHARHITGSRDSKEIQEIQGLKILFHVHPWKKWDRRR